MSTVGNNLDLQDMDDVDLLRDVERAFEIKIENSEAERITNLGDLHDLIISKTSASNQKSTKCHSAMAFYRLRSVLRNFTQRKVTPSTKISDVLKKRQHVEFSKKLYETQGLNLMTANHPFFLGVAVLSFVCFLIALFLKTAFAIGLLFVSVASVVAFFLPILPKTFCSPSATLGDVALKVEQQSIGKLGLIAGGLEQKLVWPWLVQYLRDCFAINQPIDRNTVFFKKVQQ